jgi:hypothetical protein
VERFFKIASAVAIALGTMGSVHASESRPGHSGHSGRNRDSHGQDHRGHDSHHDSDFLSKFGTRFSGGYCYKGRDHDHWTERRWFDRYHCYCYFCPYSHCYYYWCERDNCYYPVTYRPYADRDQKANDGDEPPPSNSNPKDNNADKTPMNGNEKNNSDDRDGQNGDRDQK